MEAINVVALYAFSLGELSLKAIKEGGKPNQHIIRYCRKIRKSAVK